MALSPGNPAQVTFFSFIFYFLIELSITSIFTEFLLATSLTA